MRTSLLYLLALVLTGTTSAIAQTVRGENPSGERTPASVEVLTGKQRLRWAVASTIGPESLAGGAFTAAFGTAIDKPREYGPSWAGYGKRYAMRFSGIAASNAMEAGLGSLWNEDPRYFPAETRSVKGRLGHVFLLTVTTRGTDGQFAPAYARYMAISGSNFLSNAWRADSEATPHDAVIRTLLGFAGRAGGNAFAEFWPDIRKYVFRRK